MANQPKKYKKFVATAATATLVASAIVPVASAKSFNDVADNNDHKANIDKISDLGYMGTGDNFNPGGNLTRGQVAIILANWAKDAAGKEVPADYKTAQRFEDVELTADDKLLQSAALVFDNEIFSGSNGNLLPANDITRLQMALVLNKAYKAIYGVTLVELAGDTSDVEIGDLDLIPAEHQGVVKALKKLNITAPANFNPNGKVTRGQFATFFIKTIEAEAPTPKVVSVSAINAKELEIKFNKAIDEDTVVNGSDQLINVTISAIATATPLVGPLNASLSADGKTLTVTASNNFDGQYAVTVPTTVKDVNDDSVAAYTSIVSASDTTRPTVTGVTYTDFQTAKITFSEPLKDIGAISANNTDIGFGSLSADGKSITVNLAHANVKADTDYKVTIIGAKDFKDNLITPNPVEVTVKKSTSDTVKPTVTALATVNDKTFTITFSEKLIGNPTFTVNGNTVVATGAGAGQVNGSITKDSTGLVYTVTLDSSLVVSPATSALATITASFSDLSGNTGDAFSRIVEFKKDTTAPGFLSSTVEKINGKEYLVLNYNENVSVVDAKSITGKVVKDYVESSITPVVTDTVDGGNGVNFELHNPTNGKSKSVRLDLAALTSGAYTLNLPTGLVVDESANNSTAITVSFNRTTDVDTGKPQLTSAGTNGITKVDNDTYTVSFDRQLDAASALNLSNYSIEGASIKSAIFTQNNASGAVVRLTLNENSVNLTGERTVSIKNIKSAAGVTMDAVTTTETLTENVKPVLNSAVLTGLNEITLTYSENVDVATIAGDGEVDFKVLIDGVDVTAFSPAVTVTEAAATNKVTLTLSRNLTPAEYAKVITIAPAADFDVADSAGNVQASFTSFTVNK